MKQRHAVLEDRRRNGLPTGNIFIDCSYQKLVEDPIGTIQKLYSDLDLKLEPEVEREMTSWLKENKKNKYGRHVYSLEQYHLTSADIGEVWAEYLENFKDYI